MISAKLSGSAALAPSEALDAYDQLRNMQTLISGSPFNNLQGP